jgi:hypothetical protein
MHGKTFLSIITQGLLLLRSRCTTYSCACLGFRWSSKTTINKKRICHNFVSTYDSQAESAIVLPLVVTTILEMRSWIFWLLVRWVRSFGSFCMYPPQSSLFDTRTWEPYERNSFAFLVDASKNDSWKNSSSSARQGCRFLSKWFIFIKTLYEPWDIKPYSESLRSTS